MSNSNKASKVVAAAVIGYDFRRVIVAGRDYVIKPPTIARLAGAAYWLSDIDEAHTLKEMMQVFSNMESLSKALSWFITGDESLSDELSRGTLDEVVEGIENAFQLIDTANFLRLSTLAKSAARMIAKPK